MQTKEEPFFYTQFKQFLKDFQVIGNISDYIEREEFEYHKEGLDERFFNSLRYWIDVFESIKFDTDDKRKKELIVNLINKFIFVQTLDDYGIVDFQWISKTWKHYEDRWRIKGKFKVIESFLREIEDFFFEYYDTELFKERILDYVKQDKQNIEKFYAGLLQVLGLTEWQKIIGGNLGILQYKFKYIDEDIFGKAYETYLVEIRKQKGIYYTPQYVTKHIVSKTVLPLFHNLQKDIKQCVNSENFERANELARKFISIKILDPACGSGSFLIKALRTIKDQYTKLLNFLNEAEQSYKSKVFDKTDTPIMFLPKDLTEKVSNICDIKNILGAKNERELIAKIILRHLFGNDLDRNALDVAKVNLWLEGIKLAPAEFRYERLSGTNHILPSLKANLCNSDSLIGLKIDSVVEYLISNFQNKILKIHSLRRKYIDAPTNPELLDDVLKIKNGIKNKLNEEFISYLQEEEKPKLLLEKLPTYWPLEYWFSFFDENGNVFPKQNRGFDVVLGNPPYFTEARGYKEVFRIYAKSPLVEDYYEKNMDIFYYFIELGLDLLKVQGSLGYIILDYWRSRTSGVILKEKILRESIYSEGVTFGNFKVFKDAPGQHSSIIVLEKQRNLLEIKEGYTLNITKVVDKEVSEDEVRQALLNNKFSNKVMRQKVMLGYNQHLRKITYVDESGEVVDKIETTSNYKIPRDNIMKGVATMVSKSKNGKGVFVLSDEELHSLSFNKAEKSLIRPFFSAKQIDSFFIEDENSEWLIYSQHRYIDFEENFIKSGIKKCPKRDPRSVRKEMVDKIKQKYPTITEHLAKFQGDITSDKKPYGLHRPKRLGIFVSPSKVISIRKTHYPKFAWVEKECFMDDSAYFVIPENGISQKYLTGLLNSKLMWFWFLCGPQKTHGRQLQIDKEILESAPLIKVSKEKENIITKLVDKIRILKTCKFKIIKLWVHWRKSIQSDTTPLSQILMQDKEAIKKGKDQFWASKVTFYPDACNEILRHEFENFIIKGDSQNPINRLYGSNNKQELVYEIECRNRELMNIIFLSVLELLISKAKIKTLKQILAKTSIPIIRPNIVLSTPNLMKKINLEFKKWIRKNYPSENLEADLPVINNKIEKIEAELDARIFELYRLNQYEVKRIFDTLGLSLPYQEMVFQYC